jgi:cofilin
MTDDKKKVVLEKEAPFSATYADFIRDLPKNDCRYAVYHFEYEGPDGKRAKILFYNW